MNRTLFLTLIFCSVINAAPAQPPFLGADSVDVVVKEVAQIPESSQTFTVSSELFFSFFKKSQAFENISRCECTQTKECSKLLTEHCQTLSQAKQIRKTSIATFKLFFPEEKLSCAIKLMARKVDSQLFTTFTIFVPQKNDPKITHALINFCNAAIPRLSFMQKHSGKVYSGVFVVCVGLGLKWYSGSILNLRRKYSSYVEVKKITQPDAKESCIICTNDFKENEQQWSTRPCTCNRKDNSFCCEKCILTMMVPNRIMSAAQEFTPGDGREYSITITRTTCPACNQ
jgi:hypothetical protein